MNKVGKKPRLDEAQQEQLRLEYARYQRGVERFKRLEAQFGPTALGRKYRIATPTVLDYARCRHKGGVNYGLRTAAPRSKGLRVCALV